MALEGLAVVHQCFGGGDALDISVSFPLELAVNSSTRRFPMVEVVRNDVGIELEFTVKDKDGTAIDISTPTITLKASKEWGTSNKISAACTKTTPASGECKYTFVSGDLDTEGDYIAALELDFGGGVVKTTERFKLRVLTDAPHGS